MHVVTLACLVKPKCDAMCANMGITPTLEHYNCMIDLYCRAGCFDKALVMIEDMPFSADQKVLHTLLSACQRWENVKLGRIAFEHAMQLDDKDAVAYISMCNICAAAELKMDMHYEEGRCERRL